MESMINRAQEQGLIRPDLAAILEWKSFKRSAAALILINVFFFIICYLQNSVIALFLLFIIFLSGLGILLHLIYMSTSQEYRDKLESQEDDQPSEGSSRKERKTVEQEHVSIERIIPPLLIAFEILLRLENFYNDIATIKNYEATFTAVALLPIVWGLLYVTRLPDSCIVWALFNLIYLWPLLRHNVYLH